MKIPFRPAALSALAIILSGCAVHPSHPTTAPNASQNLPSVVITSPDAQRVDGRVGGVRAPSAAVSLGDSVVPSSSSEMPVSNEAGSIALDFTDTDIREVVAQILGGLLKANYTIDPVVRGNVTLRTATSLNATQLVPTLRVLLGQVGATLVQSGGIYRVVPNGTGPVGGGTASNGFTIVPLHFAQSEELAKVLQPFVTSGGRLVADPASNTLLVGGDPDGRDALVGLARSFDIDAMAGQSYALFPVGAGEARSFATSLQDALRNEGSSSPGRDVKVVALRKVDAVLVVSNRPAGVAAARRIVALIDRQRRATLRSWRVYYLHNGRSNDVANFLQRAFTPNDVTAQSTSERSGSSTAPGETTQSLASANSPGGQGLPGSTSPSGGMSGTVTSQPLSGAGGTGSGSTGQGAASNDAGQNDAGQDGLMGGSGQEQDADRMRIIANKQNNAVAVYATQDEADLIEGMLRKIDIMPQQVRIDATVAEVTLNDSLQYGTQYFFKQGGLNGALASVFSSGTNGFFIAGNNKSAQAAIEALQSVTEVHVLSSPQLLVMDNQSARLQVGNLVPYLSATSQSTITSGSPVITSINYRQTGVILDVTPRIGAGGLVTLDIAQEVSDIDNTVTTTGIDSPSFSDRTVRTTIAVQDGQTVGLAGLIKDSVSDNNAGLPFLKDVPVLGTLLGQQNNTRTRTEMLVLVTPHVVHDQREARSLTQELLEALPNAANTSERLRTTPISGSSDPQAAIRHKLGLEQ